MNDHTSKYHAAKSSQSILDEIDYMDDAKIIKRSLVMIFSTVAAVSFLMAVVYTINPNFRKAANDIVREKLHYEQSPPNP